ncbi:MAG: LLM class flavin-dependent oxidoreductase [Chloroflexota bacterium]
MNFGLFMMPIHPPEKNRTQSFQEDIELIVHADELGMSEAWIGQHHTVAWEPIPSNDVFIANLLPRTKQIRLGAGVSIMPQHHPVNVAVRTAFLDHLSEGRINCGFGQGGVSTDWGLFDLPDPKTQGLMTVEAIDMVLKLWQTDAPFDFQGDFYHIKLDNPIPEHGIGELLKPYQKPYPPIGMSVMREGSLAARMAGQRGWMPLSTSLVPVSTVVTHWDTYCEGAKEAGLPEPNRDIWRVSRSIFVADSNDEAWDHAINGTFGRSFEYMIMVIKMGGALHLLKDDPNMPDEDVTVEYILKNLCIVGDKQTCLERLHELWERTGGFGTFLMVAHDWDDQAKWVKSMDMLAKEMIPAMPTL